METTTDTLIFNDVPDQPDSGIATWNAKLFYFYAKPVRALSEEDQPDEFAELGVAEPESWDLGG